MKQNFQQMARQLLEKKRTRYALISFALFLILYGVFAFIFVPNIIKEKTETFLTQQYQRKTTVEKVVFSPYTLTTYIHHFKMMEKNGEHVFASFDTLELNLSLQSLFRMAPVIEELKLDNPYVSLIRDTSARLNIHDFMHSKKAEESSESSPFAVYNIQVNNGHIAFQDRPKNKNHTLSEINIGIPFLSSYPSQLETFVQPYLGAKINGSALEIKGKSKPFSKTKETSVQVNLNDIAIPEYISYLPYELGAKIKKANLDVAMNVRYEQEENKKPALLLTGNIALKDVDVTELDNRPIISLPKLSISVDNLDVLSNHFAVDHITFKQPSLHIRKTSEGRVNALNIIPASTSTKQSGTDSQSSYRFSLKDFSIEAGHLNFVDESSTQPLTADVDQFNFQIKDGEFDLLKKRLSIEKIASNKAHFHIEHAKRRDKPIIKKIAKTIQSGADSYDIDINQIAISQWSADFKDHSLPRKSITKIAPLSFHASEISTDPTKNGQLKLHALVDKKGEIAIEGSMGLAPLSAQLSLNFKNASLLPIQPYITDALNLRFTRANLSSNSQLAFQVQESGNVTGKLAGDIAFNDVMSVDKVSAQKFISWRTLGFNQINTNFDPFSLSINKIDLDKYYARIIIAKNGRINLQDIVRNSDNENTSLTEAQNNAVNENETVEDEIIAEATESTTPTPPIKINTIRLKNGRVRFTDLFIKPTYTTNMRRLGGTIKGLSSESESTANVALKGNINSAPLNINGTINPLRGDLFVDLKGDVTGIELAPLSSYAKKYTSYGIEKGKLSFDVAYKVDNRKLDASNHLVLDQLTFGEKVESPTATSLPVMLAVALLRDSNGVIDINLPISGSLDDPSFSMGGIIFKAFVNLLTKAITSPFSLLSAAFGGSTEDLSWVSFENGDTAINKASESKLNTMLKALQGRPALKLEIKGVVDLEKDHASLAEMHITRKMRRIKRDELKDGNITITPNSLRITEEEYPKLLKEVYEDADFDRPRNFIGMLKNVPLEEMESRLFENEKANITRDDVINLGNQRAEAVKTWLLENKIDPTRIYLLATEVAKSEEEGGRVIFSLK